VTAVLLLSALGLLAMPAWARPVGRRLRPAEWAKLCAVLLGIGAFLLETALALAGLSVTLRAAGMGAIAELCQRLLGGFVLGGTVAGTGAAVAAVVLPILAGRAVVRARRTCRAVRVEPGVGWRDARSGHEVVVLPSDQLIALSVEGKPAQVILSSALVDTLPADQLAAVLRHEAAHLRHRHQRYLLLASTIGRSIGLLPYVRHSLVALRCALERWADEEAASGAAEGRASVYGALLRVAEAVAMPEVAAFLTPATVVERIEALRTIPERRTELRWRVLVYLPVTLLGLTTTVALASTLGHVGLLDLAGLCLT